jgi:hypothetical protein
MRFRGLAVFPLLYAAVFTALAVALDLQALDGVIPWQRLAVRILGVVGCFLAVSVFERGDHLRRAWLWLGWGSVAIFLRDLLRLLPALQPPSAPPWTPAALTGLGVLSNLALLAGIWTLAHAWKRASIALPGGRSGVVTIAVVTALLALAVAGPGALQAARDVARGEWGSLILLVSAVVDIISLCLIAPLLLTAVSLRGGLFSWPWGLITASRLSWLLYDGAVALAPSSTPAAFPLAELCRGVAITYLFAAGVAQYLVIRQVRRATS